MPRLLLILIVACAAPLIAHGQVRIEFTGDPEQAAGITRPAGSGRIVKLFDFEGQEGDSIELPEGWYRPQSQTGVRDRPGYPLYNRALLDYTTAHDGKGSMKLPTRGGSTGLRLVDGVIHVFPDADYLVSAWIKTTALEFAGATITATLITADGKVIEESVVSTRPIVSKDDWTQVRIPVLGEHPEAAFMRIDLDLVQRALFEPRADALDIRVDDYNGAAWFDNVSVMQIPRVQLTCGSSAGLLRGGLGQTLHVHVRDLTGDTVTADLSVYDSRGRTLTSVRVPVPGGNYEQDFALNIAELGWYRAVLSVWSDVEPLGSHVLDFAILDAPGNDLVGESRTDLLPVGATVDRERFVADFGRAIGAHTEALKAIGVASGAGEARITIWDEDLTIPDTTGDVPMLARFLNDLRSYRLGVGATLARVPESVRLAGRSAPDDPMIALTRPRDTWGPWLLPYLDRLGQYIHTWQFGMLGDFGSNLRLGGGAISGARGVLDPYVPGGEMVVPWPAEVFIDRGAAPGADRLAVTIPPGFGDDALDTLARQAAASGARRVEIYVQPIDPRLFGFRASQDDLARRIVRVWDRLVSRGEHPSLTSASLIMGQPWTLGEGVRTQVSPAYTLPMWRTLVQALDGRRVVARFSPERGVHAFVLAPAPSASQSRSSALVLFRDTGMGEARVAIPLGHGVPTLVDINGNRSELRRRDDWLHEFTVGESPVIVEGVDAPLLTFLSSIRFTPMVLPPGAVDFETEAIFTNPWGINITGRATIIEPGGFLSDGTRDRAWSIRPLGFEFYVPPGGERSVPITLSADARIEIGQKRLVADIKLTAERDYPVIRHVIPFEIGVGYMDVTLVARAVGEDVVVEAAVENRDDAQALTLELSASALGHAKALATVSSLSPRQRTIRSFLFAGGAAALAGTDISVSILDRQRNIRVFKSVELERSEYAGVVEDGP